jgi:hypothetical protein
MAMMLTYFLSPMDLSIVLAKEEIPGKNHNLS